MFVCQHCGVERKHAPIFLGQKHRDICLGCNKAVAKELVRETHLNVKYGITIERYDELMLQQKSCCRICGRHQDEFNRRLAVDHCHSTGRVRGLLCGPCNLKLGWYEKWKAQVSKHLGT